MNTRRTFTTEQKLLILKEASENGITNTLEKHGIFPSVYYKWKKKIFRNGRRRPISWNGIPKEVLDYAAKNKVKIREITGKALEEYNKLNFH